MPVSHELQDIISGVSVAIAERQRWGRVELEQLRRSLDAAARASAAAERAKVAAGGTIGELVAGIEGGVADLAVLARRASAVLQAEAAR